VGTEQPEHDRDDRPRHDTEGQQVEVRRAHAIGKGEIAEKGQPDRGAQVGQPLKRRAEEGRPGQRQGGPQHHQHAGQEGRRCEQPLGCGANRTLAAINDAGDDQKNDGDRGENHGGTTGDLR
jgi:hypothetical protein